MRRRAAVCAMDLIHGRGFLGKSGILCTRFTLYSSNFDGDRDFSAKPYSSKIDFSLVKELDDAVQLFQKMKSMQREPTVRMYNNLLSVTVKIEQFSFALYVFDQMLRMGLAVDVYSMNIAMNCCCLLKDIDSAFALMGFFFKRGYEPNVATLCTLIKGLFLEDKVAEAVKLFGKVVDLKLCEPNDVMILHMMDGLRKAGHVVVAQDCLLRLESSGWRLNVKAYTALIDGLCKAGMVDNALQVLSQMIGKGIKPNVVTYNSVIKGLCDIGKLTDVKDMLTEMANSKMSPNVITFTMLMDAYFKEGKMEEALSLLHTIEVKGFTPDIVMYGSLIDGLCKNGMRDSAIDVLNQLPSKGLQPNVQTYTMIIDSLCQEGSFKDVKQWLVEMENHGCGPDRVTYHVIIRSLLKQNELHLANSFMEEMHKKGFCSSVPTDPVQKQNEDSMFFKLLKEIAS